MVVCGGNAGVYVCVGGGGRGHIITTLGERITVMSPKVQERLCHDMTPAGNREAAESQRRGSAGRRSACTAAGVPLT